MAPKTGAAVRAEWHRSSMALSSTTRGLMHEKGTYRWPIYDDDYAYKYGQYPKVIHDKLGLPVAGSRASGER